MVYKEPLPEKNLGTLRGGRWGTSASAWRGCMGFFAHAGPSPLTSFAPACRYPFLYDPVYGLPVVGEVAKYGEVLRDMRLGQVKEVLWFANPRPGVPGMLDFEGRCLLRYLNDSVKQAVLLPSDLRIRQVGPQGEGRREGTWTEKLLGLLGSLASLALP
jgi:hypothetical protein